MSTIGELARQHTDLSKEQTTHLVNLISEWGMLADLCFADLMLHVPVEAGKWMVVAQVRAATGQTCRCASRGRLQHAWQHCHVCQHCDHCMCTSPC